MVELTQLQRWYLCHLTRTNEWLAIHRGVAVKTVKNTLSTVYSKLGVWGLRPSKRQQALMRALWTEVIDLDEIDMAEDEWRLPRGWCRERILQLHQARWREWRQNEI